MTTVDRTGELKNRVEAKQAEIKSTIEKLKAEAKGAKNDELERLENSLKEVQLAVHDGWDSLSESTAKRLNEWLKS